ERLAVYANDIATLLAAPLAERLARAAAALRRIADELEQSAAPRLQLAEGRGETLEVLLQTKGEGMPFAVERGALQLPQPGPGGRDRGSSRAGRRARGGVLRAAPAAGDAAAGRRTRLPAAPRRHRPVRPPPRRRPGGRPRGADFLAAPRGGTPGTRAVAARL